MALQLGPLQNIAPRSTVAPITDFMEAFRSGFITIDDINKRTMATANQATATKTNIAAQDLQRRQIAGQSELLPGQLQNQAVAQDVQAAQLAGQQATVPLQAEVATQVLRDEADELNPDPAIRQGAIQRKTERQFQQLFGTPPPEVVQVPDTGVVAATFEDWYQANKVPQVAAAATGTAGTDQDRAAVFNQLEAQKNTPATQAEYQAYVESTKTRSVPISKGEPKYYETLRNQIQQKLEGAAIRGAQIQALPGVLTKQAEVAAGAPAAAAKARATLEKEVQDNKTVANFRLATRAIQQGRDLATKPNPSNADDLGLIYATVRALDPNSAVREGEIALLKRGAGLPNEIVQQFNRLFGRSSIVLTADQRNQILGLINTQEVSTVATTRPEFERISANAAIEGVPIDSLFNESERQLLQDIGTPGAAPAPTPATAPPAGSLQSLVGKRVTLKNGQSGVVRKNPDGSYSLGQ